MDRAAYLQQRKLGDVVSICYLYYLENSPKPHVTQRDFSMLFNIYVMNVEGNTVINNFIMGMDKSFNINILTDTRTNEIINFY